MIEYVAPSFSNNAFTCPYCWAYAHQIIRRQTTTFNRSGTSTQDLAVVSNIATTQCSRCRKFAFWCRDEMIYPAVSTAPRAVDDMPDDVKEDFQEARKIVQASPRGAAALLRLAVQKLMPHLGEKGKKIDDDIASLVKKGLRVDIQQALDTLRVIGNESVHPGTIDLRDEPQTAIALFRILNVIIHDRITQPKEIAELYGNLPPEKREAIARRDGN